MDPSDVKLMRKEVGLTTTQAASCVSVSVRTWQRYESGERPIPDGVVELFCIKNKLDYPFVTGKAT